MAVKIRLKRLGKKKAPFYRVVVMDSRKKRDGRAIEEIGIYHPTNDPSVIEIDSERAQYWLGVGAQPSDAVAALLKITGDLQKFKGEEGAESTYKTAEEKEAFVAPDKDSVIADKEDDKKESEVDEDSEEQAEKAETEEDATEEKTDDDSAEEKADEEETKES
ncbi:MAG: 30S ribosomal protein S16 [Micrococcaceae bacterium]